MCTENVHKSFREEMYSKLPMFVLDIRFGYNEKCCFMLTSNVELVQCLQKTRIHKSHVL